MLRPCSAPWLVSRCPSSPFPYGTEIRWSASKYDGFVGSSVTWGKYVWVEEAGSVLALIFVLFIGLQR